MLLTITTTHQPATDLGHLLRKHPGKAHVFEQSFGRAHVFYPEATEQACTATLLLEVDPVGLVRNRRGPAGEGRTLEQYVNDRPYVASSFLSVALADVFGSAIAGKAKERVELVDAPLPLKAVIASVPCFAGEDLLRRLFEPLGYSVAIEGRPLDPQFPDWGPSRYYRLTLEAQVPLRQLLTHLYVLLPVLDNDKHYWVPFWALGIFLFEGIRDSDERIVKHALNGLRTWIDRSGGMPTASSPDELKQLKNALKASSGMLSEKQIQILTFSFRTLG